MGQKSSPSTTKAPVYHAVVTDAFGSYQRGARITDPEEVEAILVEQPNRTVRVEMIETNADAEPQTVQLD